MMFNLLVLALMMGLLLANNVQEITSIDAQTTLECHRREYSFVIENPYTMPDGRVLKCKEPVTIKSCWGRCQTSEIGDYVPPYKVSDHTVCTYEAHTVKKIALTTCPEDHPDPYYEVIEAESCTCKVCSDKHTNCEQLLR